MNSKTLTVFSTIIALAVLGLFASRFLAMPSFGSVVPPKYLNVNDIKGISVVYDGKEWTLNFDQQNEFVDLINKTAIVAKEKYSSENKNVPFQKLIVYPFSGKAFDITPVGLLGSDSARILALKSNDLVFSAPNLTDKGYLRDFSTGKLMALIQGAYSSAK